MNPARSSSAGVAPTTTQSRSDTSRPSSRSRTAPPTKYTCMARMLTIRTALVLTACLALARLRHNLRGPGGQGAVADPHRPQAHQEGAGRPRRGRRAQAAPRGRCARRGNSPARELGLPNNKSYTSYADLKRDFVVWSVVATPEFSVEPREWCFPDRRLRRVSRIFQQGQRRSVRRDAALRGPRHDRRRRAGVFHARQVQRPDPQHHDDLRRRRARLHHVSRALAPAGLHPGRHFVQRGLCRHRGTGRPGALAEIPRPRSRSRQVSEAARRARRRAWSWWRSFAAS